jgi:hypothetical protein
MWSTVHGLVNLAMTQRLEMVEQNGGHDLISKTIDSVMKCIFK